MRLFNWERDMNKKMATSLPDSSHFRRRLFNLPPATDIVDVVVLHLGGYCESRHQLKDKN